MIVKGGAHYFWIIWKVFLNNKYWSFLFLMTLHLWWRSLAEEKNIFALATPQSIKLWSWIALNDLDPPPSTTCRFAQLSSFAPPDPSDVWHMSDEGSPYLDWSKRKGHYISYVLYLCAIAILLSSLIVILSFILSNRVPVWTTRWDHNVVVCTLCICHILCHIYQ